MTSFGPAPGAPPLARLRMPSPGPAARQPLPAAIDQWRDGALDWIRAGDADAAAALSAHHPAALSARHPPVTTPRVVVIGETNRGKSSLVNAILGMPGLSPVDAGVATCTYLLFRHATELTAVARFGRGMADIAIPPQRLADWATMDGDGDGDPDLPPPRWIEIGVPSAVLERVDLVDTPGVGGLVAAHAELAAEAAATATALLFVVDASTPFTQGELAFLAGAADRVDTVHFVMTKTDVYRGWREIAAADRALLARHAPRFADAPIHPVSARLAQAADAQADPKIAELLRTQSGIAELQRVLTEDVAARAELLLQANEVRSCLTVIAGGIAAVENSRKALTTGADQAEQLRARREELLGQRKVGGRTWQVLLRAETQRARVELSSEVAREVREAQTMFRGAIDGAAGDELKKLPFHIDAYAQAMTLRAHSRLTDAMERLCHRVLAELFTPAELAGVVAGLATRPYQSLVVHGPDKPRSMDETIMTLGGASMGFTLSRLALTLPLGLVPALGVVLMPASIVIGGAAAWYLVRSRRRMATKQHLKQWLMEVLGEAKAQIDQNIAAQFIEADQQLTLALDDAVGRQVDALEAQIREVDGALKLNATERAGRLRSVDERRSAGATLAAAGEALLGRVRTERPEQIPAEMVDTGQGSVPDGATGPAPVADRVVPDGPGDQRVTLADGRVIVIPAAIRRIARPSADGSPVPPAGQTFGHTPPEQQA